MAILCETGCAFGACALTLLMTTLIPVDAQYMPNYRPFGFRPTQPLNRNFIRPAPPPPQKTVADDAEEFWTSNSCVYPPKDFYPLYRTACDVQYDTQTFYSGICRSFFNVSKSMCGLDGSNDDEVQTMTSITQIQETIGNDEICDTLLQMKESDQSLFPRPEGKNQWFESTYNFLFSPDMCQSACGLDNVHPLCFGFLLNYNYVQYASTRQQAKDDDTTSDDVVGESANVAEESSNVAEKGDSEDEDRPQEKVLDDAAKVLDDYDAVNATEPEVEGIENMLEEPLSVEDLIPILNITEFRPNPKLLDMKPSELEEYNYDDVIYKEDENADADNAILSEMFQKNPKLLSDILEISDAIDADDGEDVDSSIYPIDDNLNILDEVVQLPNGVISEIETSYSDDEAQVQTQRLTEDLESLTRIDEKEELPLLSALLLFSCAVVLLSICVLYRVRKRIGIYVRHIGQRRRNNWNYERVLTNQPEEDGYYD